MARTFLNPWVWALIYCGIVLLTQLGSITREVINWDESTFMLLGSDILEGTLPYTERFDNKPPLIFFLFAGWMGVFGQSILSVRLFGDVCLVLAALLTFGLARRFAEPMAAGAAGALYLSIHAVHPGLHTSAGLPAMVFVMGALWLLIAQRQSAWALFGAGILISLAVLTRSNLAYLALASGLWIFAVGVLRPGVQSRLLWWSAVPYGVGVLTPLVATMALFWVGDAFYDMKLASIDVALSYSDQWGMAGAAMGHTQKWIEAIAEAPFLHGIFTVLTLWALIAFLRPPAVAVDKDHADQMGWHDWALVWVFLIAILYSILKSGAVYTYYWQQFFPLTVLFVALLIDRLADQRLWRGLAFGLVAMTTLAGIKVGGPEALRVLTQSGHLEARYDIRKAADVLRPLLRPQDQVWALDHHLIMVYLDKPTVSRVVAHPSNITRTAIINPLVEAGYIAPNELQRVLDSRPEFLVTNGDEFLFYLPDHSLFDSYAAAHYHRIFKTPMITVFRRNDHPSAPKGF